LDTAWLRTTLETLLEPPGEARVGARALFRWLCMPASAIVLSPELLSSRE
jgi:hypothetical protein